MRKTIFLFLLYLAVYGAVHVKAQVRIGGGSAAHPSSILDLNPSDTTTAGGGLLLPRVHLDSTTDTGVFGINPRKGLMVYNLNEDNDPSHPTEGIYCYNGEKWLPVNPTPPKYKGGPFTITMTPKQLWMGNDGELTKLLDIDFSRFPDENDLGGCTIEYIGYLKDMEENEVIEFALIPNWQVANEIVSGKVRARAYLQIVNLRDRIVKGRVYELSCRVRVSRYETNPVNAGYVVYGTGAWLGDGKWINVAPANLGATISRLPVQLDYTPYSDSDSAAIYGDLYQWGRKKDGHQLRTAHATNTTFRSTEEGVSENLLDANGQVNDDVYDQFIQRVGGLKDWRAYPAGDPNNSIGFPKTAWTWDNPANDPCKAELEAKWRVPAADEWVQIFNSNNNTWVWKDTVAGGVPGYEIKPDGITWPTSFFLPAAGQRLSDDGQLSVLSGNYWSSTSYGDSSRYLSFNDNTIAPENLSVRANGFSVRCVADGSQGLEPETDEYTGGPYRVEVTPEQLWLGRDGELGVSPVSITFESGQNYRVECVWYFKDKKDETGDEKFFVTPGPELRMSDNPGIEEGKVYRLSCVIRMGQDNNFETSKFDVGDVVYGIGAWIGPGKWLKVANANIGANPIMPLDDQLALDHKSGYDDAIVGNYFQWGRAADTHERRNSGTIRSIVPADQLDPITGTPKGLWDGKFITSDTVSDWRAYPDIMSTEDMKKWYWRTKEEPNTGINPCNMGDNWFVMTLSQWDAIRIYNRLAWLDTDLARGVAVYPNNGSDDISFYLPISGIRDYKTGNLLPSDWHDSWVTSIWLNNPATDQPAKAMGLIWNSGSDPSINTGRSNTRMDGLPIRCVSEE
ncbi:MAG: hypothetical protein LBG45_12130 [Dysgonamonadaceae bacterium]|jgi:uncharacterized protein (TIGR02145 family)|nr:hypothetical protein [Dysgonamonadaceae bacterium]